MKHKLRLRVLADGTVIECDGHTPSEEMLRLMSAINSNKLEKTRSAAGAKFLSVALWIIGIFVVFIALCLIVKVFALLLAPFGFIAHAIFGDSPQQKMQKTLDDIRDNVS